MKKQSIRHSRWFPRAFVAVLTLASCALLTVAMDGVTRSRSAQAGTVLGAGSRLWLTGKSTMHDYHSAATDWSVALTPRDGFSEPADAAAVDKLVRESGVASVKVSLPVKGLKSEKDGLDKNLQKALKADKFPTIDVKLDKYTATPTGDSLGITAEGEITVAGKTIPLKLEGVGRNTPEGLRVTGTKPLLMTSFDVKPPTMMMGTIKTRDEVVIHWDLLLAPR
jgi:YceI-like protein